MKLTKQQLLKELQKPFIRKFGKPKVHSPFKEKIRGADVQIISKHNKGFRFSLCVIDIFSKKASVVPLKVKKRYYIY